MSDFFLFSGLFCALHTVYFLNLNSSACWVANCHRREERKKREEEKIQAEKERKERDETKRLEQEREALEEQRRLSRQAAFFSGFFRKTAAGPPAVESGEERPKVRGSDWLAGCRAQFRERGFHSKLFYNSPNSGCIGSPSSRLYSFF